MGEGHIQSWATTRRGSNPRLETDGPIIVDIPPTPPFKNSTSASSFLSLLLPFDFRISTSLTTALLIASWYFSNIGILILNKYLLTIHGYHFPIFLTALHMLSCSFYSSLSVRTFRLVSFQRISSRNQFYKIVTLSLIFCVSVVCGNSSLRYLPVSFNQAIGATTPFFTAAFSFLLTCRREEPLVYLTLLPIVLGIVLATNSEPLFHLLSFLFCITTTVGRALKSAAMARVARRCRCGGMVDVRWGSGGRRGER